MSEVQDSWKDVAGKAEALGLKLKLHLEQESDGDEEKAQGDTKAMIDDLGRKVQDAFESVGNAAKDPAVHEDVKDMGRLFKDALMATMSAVGSEVGSRAGQTSTDADADADADVDTTTAELDAGTPAEHSADEATGDEGDSGDA